MLGYGFAACLISLALIVSAGCIIPFRFVENRAVTDCYGNVLPCVTDTYDLGSQTLRWHTIYVENIVTPGVYPDGTYYFYTNGVPGVVKSIIVAGGKIIYVELEP